MRARESGQIRKEAALSGSGHVPRIRLARASHDGNARGPLSKAGRTVLPEPGRPSGAESNQRSSGTTGASLAASLWGNRGGETPPEGPPVRCRMPDDEVPTVFGWSPGKLPSLDAADTAWTLEPGSDLVLQLHLLPGTAPERIQPTVGLFFTDKPPARQPLTVKLESKAIDIPAGRADHLVEDRYVLPADVDVISRDARRCLRVCRSLPAERAGARVRSLGVGPSQVVQLVEASCGRLVAEGAVWSAMVVGPEPAVKGAGSFVA